MIFVSVQRLLNDIPNAGLASYTPPAPRTVAREVRERRERRDSKIRVRSSENLELFPVSLVPPVSPVSLRSTRRWPCICSGSDGHLDSRNPLHVGAKITETWCY